MKSLQRLCILGFFALLSVQSANAQYGMSTDTSMSLSLGAGSFLLSQQVLKSASKGASYGGATHTHRPSLSRAALDTVRFYPTGSTAGLDTLLSFYPEQERPQMRQVYQQLYNAYPQVARQIGVPTNDVASGLASFLAGSYMAYNNKNLSNDYVKPLANQFRNALASGGDMGRVSDADKQKLYDVLVMLGMLMATTQVQMQQQPDPRVMAQMRQLGKGFLEGLLKVDADRVRITSAGLRVD